ncbi:MAG: DUF3078 domain-containing protein [Alphaproteobacteria bacterium]|nr:DUF3078 domain-containing protein [Alphaproteobacteria bacterium]
MKNKIILATMCSALFAGNVKAEEAIVEVDEVVTETAVIDVKETAPEAPSNLKLNIKRVGIDVVSTEVKNADQYQNSSVAALSADSETNIKGVFDSALEYQQETYRWDNSLYMVYGETKTKPVNGDKVKNITDDQILLSSDIAYKLWKYEEADVGPFANVGYDTQFKKVGDAPRRKIVRGKSGLKLFNGKYIDNLYIAGVVEHDMTYSQDVEKFAMEVGGRAKYPLREGVDFELEGYYRDYMHFSKYIAEDLKYDLNVTGRMNVTIVNNYKLAPFVSYRYAESRGATKAGSNFTIGLSFNYGNIFDL